MGAAVIVVKLGLLALLLARRILPWIVRRREARWAVLEAFADLSGGCAVGFSAPWVMPETRYGLSTRATWKIILAFERRKWLVDDGMWLITAAGREALALHRGDVRAPLPSARLVSD